MRRRVCLLAIVVGFFPMVGITQQQFQVKLRGALVADDQSFVAVPLQDATPSDMAKFKPSLDRQPHVQTGVIALGPSIKISAALVKMTETKKCLYYDPAGSGTFAPNQRVCFEVVTNQGNYADEARVELPIHIGPYSKIPLILHTLRPEDPRNPVSIPLLFYSSQILIEGMASIDGRDVPLAYRLNLSRGSVDPVGATMMDEDGDGLLDRNRERKVGTNTPPMFHLGNRFVSTKSVDLPARRAVLISHDASEYVQFDYGKGSTLPDFRFTTFDGKTKSISSLEGRAILIDFWATWCQPCITELPNLKAVYGEFHAKGFEIVGIDGDADSPEKAVAAIAKLGIEWPEGRYDKELVEERFRVLTWPTLILVDERRRVVTSDSLELSGNELRHAVETVLAQNPKK